MLPGALATAVKEQCQNMLLNLLNDIFITASGKVFKDAPRQRLPLAPTERDETQLSIRIKTQSSKGVSFRRSLFFSALCCQLGDALGISNRFNIVTVIDTVCIRLH